MAVGDGLLAVGTCTYDFVKVRIQKHHSKPPVDLADWDHVTECGLEVHTRFILISGCLSRSGIYFEVVPGEFRVRVCHANLAESEQEVPAGWTGEYGDWYLVQFWPAKPSPPRVLKRWKVD